MDIKVVLIFTLPIVFFFLLFATIISALGGGVADFDDALGASSVSGGQTGDIVFEASSKDAQKFYERLNDVKLDMQEEGKTVDVLKVAAVYHILNITNNTISIHHFQATWMPKYFVLEKNFWNFFGLKNLKLILRLIYLFKYGTIRSTPPNIRKEKHL